MNKSFYFRKSSVLASDDDNDNSLILPVNKVFHMIGASTQVIFYFKGLVENPEEFLVSPNSVVISVSSGTAKTVMESIANAVDNGKESIITIFDAVTGDKVDSNVSAVALITIDET